MYFSDSRYPVNEARLSGAWHALYTRHQHEKVVAEILSNKGFEVFLPLYSVVHRWKDRTKALRLPLYPCYVFLRGGLDRQLQIVTTPAVYGIVGSGGRPSVIPDGEIDAVRQVIETSLRVEPHPFLKCGEWVRVKSGPLEGIEGILIRKKSLFRLVLSVELLQKSVAAEVDVSMVECLHRQSAAVASLRLESQLLRRSCTAATSHRQAHDQMRTFP